MTIEEAIEIIKNELVFESGVIREALEVIERDIEKANNKKVGMIFHNDGGFEYICPVCKGVINEEQEYCDECGQSLDWSDE